MNETGNSRSTTTPAGSDGTEKRSQGLVDTVRDTAATQLTNQKNRAVDGLGSVAQAVRQSTEQLRQQDHDVIARYVEQAADQLDRMSQRIRSKDVGELMNDVQSLARRQPAMFIGGAFALGLIGARFFKSSARDEEFSSGRSMPNPAMSNSGTEYRGYAQSGGAASYPGADVSRVHDYQSSPTLLEEVGSSTVTTGFNEGTTPSAGGVKETRSRRGARSERT